MLKHEYEALKAQNRPGAAFENWKEKAELERYELAKLFAFLRDPATPAALRAFAELEFETRIKNLAACEENQKIAERISAAEAKK
jgi:hypothetical protein